jgi:hypothetical protein
MDKEVTTPQSGPRPFAGSTYSGWHVYLWREHRLGGRPCDACRISEAKNWSHTNTCSETKWGTTSGSGNREMAWCPHLHHYVPMCRSCHKMTDARRGGMRGLKHSAETRAKISLAVSAARKSVRS